ncbi:MAG TPA: hypothetical protein VGE88_07005 [Lysobacter sp.]
MAYFLCQDFSSGLDVRKSEFTAAVGSLQALDDGQITRGGEIEKRKKFEDRGDLLTATRALCSAKRGTGSTPDLIVFGDNSTPAGLPADVVYQRLQHPDGNVALTDIADYTLFNGKVFVAADFADGSQWLYYDGSLVTDWGAGIVRASMTSNDQIAEHLRQLVDASPSYVATRSGASVLITGPAGVDYAVAAETQDGGGTPNQSLTINSLVPPVAGTANVKAVGEFAIILGENGAGNYVDQVRVDNGGVYTDLISAPVPFNGTPERTALDVVTAINAGNAVHGYVASTVYGKVYVGAPESLGASANGRILEVAVKGSIILANGKFAIIGGPAGAGNEITSVAVNGVIVSTAVAWTTSDAFTAGAMATNIRVFASNPKMTAVALGNTVFVSPERVRSNDPDFSLVVVTSGNVNPIGGASAPVEVDYPDYPDPPRPGFPPRQVP